MKEGHDGKSPHRLWAEFRFSVVGRLLAAPPGDGELAGELRKLMALDWRHPLSGKAMKFGFSTVQGWYYAAKNEKNDPVGRLRSKTRSDLGTSRRLSEAVAEVLAKQYALYPHWTYQLHADNLRVAVEAKSELGAAPSYPTVRRYMKRRGLRKRPKPKSEAHAAAINRIEACEVRTYELKHVNALWHLDFHGCPLKIVTDEGSCTAHRRFRTLL